MNWGKVGEAGLALIIFLGAASTVAFGADWDGDTSNQWDNPSNWEFNTQPSINNPINIDGAPPNSPVITSTTGNTSLPGSALSISGTSGSGTGLTINGEGMLSTLWGRIGDDEGTEGTVTVTGENSSWTNSSFLTVGYKGTGTMNIEAGGEVSSNSGNLGTELGSEGTVTVTGDGSSWMIDSDLYVGGEGMGTLTVSNGGLVSNDYSRIGDYAVGGDGRVIVTGLGSAWEVEDDIDVGFEGKGTVTIANGGLVSVSDSFNLTNEYPTAEGTLNIGAAADAPDGPATPGRLETTYLDFGDGTGTLVFNHTGTSYEFDADMSSNSGTSTIEHYAGYTRLTGDNGGFTQTTNIHGGTLAVEDELGGEVNVMDGGTLGGSGEVGGTVMVGDGGTLAPGSSIGTLNVTDNVTQEGGSTFAVEVDDQGNSDRLNVTGSYIIEAGVTLDVKPENGTDNGSTYDPSTEYTIVTTTGGVTGQFAGVTEDFIFLAASLDYSTNPNNIYLILEQAFDFVSAAKTPNEMQIANALDGLPSDNPLKEALYSVTSEAEAQDAFNQLSGAVHPSLKGALIENGQKAVEAVNDRFRNAFADGGGGADLDTGAWTTGNGPATRPTNDVWMSGFGNWMDIDATLNTAKTDNDFYGVFAGIDREIGQYARLGLLAGYGRTNTSVDAMASESDVDSYTIGAYGGADNGRAALSLGALYTWHAIDSTRSVTNPVTETLTADYDAQSFQVFAEAAYRTTMGQATMEPFAGVSYINLHTDAFSETGGISALSSPSQTTSTTFTTFGLRSSIALASNVLARGMVGWRHAFGDVDPTSTFTIAGSDPFTILGAPIAEDAAVIEAGLDAQVSGSLTVGASYEGQYAGGAQAHGINANLEMAF